ncbi:MAG: HigA family addiction module antitoxin [Xenococcaceae cyanobacterium MO_188.B32]|nr:HigA family addiction module antitoxin [Xenococcaceae cyanobacterium MO_188.B32]
MVNIPTNRPPTSPGEMLREEFLKPMGLTQQQLADGIGVSYQRINELINGKRGITTSTALRLAKYFDTSPDFWLNMQRANDIYQVLKREAEQIEKIKPMIVSPKKELS